MERVMSELGPLNRTSAQAVVASHRNRDGVLLSECRVGVHAR